MKKIWIVILSFAMLFVGGIMLTNNFVTAHADTISAKEFSVSNADDLKAALAAPSMDPDGTVPYLTKNIFLSKDIENLEIDITEISEFIGIFDGLGHKIKNLTLTSGVENITHFALIPTAQNATIKNLKIEGALTYDLSKLSADGGIVGGLVGYGENVIIENCEFNLTTITGLDINQQISFGTMAGELYGADSKVENCISYFKSDSMLKQSKKVAFGGLVGQLNQGVIYNSICNGEMNVRLDTGVQLQEGILQYYGGIVGKMIGANAQVRNCLFGGKLETYTSQYNFVGAIVGGCSDAVEKDNVRNDYYLQAESYIAPVGDGKISSRSNLQKLSNIDEKYVTINEEVLTADIFDVALQKWDLDYVWVTRDNKIVLQKFQKFNFVIPNPNFENKIISDSILDTAELIDKPAEGYSYGAQ